MKYDENEMVEFFHVFIFCVVMGALNGRLQGIMIGGSAIYGDATYIGTVFALVLGTSLYYLLVRGHLSVIKITLLSITCTISGAISAYLVGAVSMVITPLVLIVGCIVIRVVSKKNRYWKEKENGSYK